MIGGNISRNWPSRIINSTKNKTTGFSPFYLMYGRESKLPVDGMFPDVNAGDKHYTTHEEFARDWEDSMNKACEIVKKNMKKSGDYNKEYYDKKSKAVEISVGDMVLMKNVREKGGTGKLKTYWEESIFKVVEKKENLPVYRIQNIKKSKDVRVVHRNLLMKCNELPLNVFDDKPTSTVRSQPKTTKSQQKRSTRFAGHLDKPPQQQQEKQMVEDENVDTLDSRESDDDDLLVAVYEDPVLVEGGGSVADVSPSEEESEEDGSRNEESSRSENESGATASSESDGEAELESDTEQEHTTEESDHSTTDVDSEEEPQRRSRRVPVRKQVFTYNEPGGNPVLVPAGQPS